MLASDPTATKGPSEWALEAEGSLLPIYPPDPPSDKKNGGIFGILEHFSRQILSLFISKFSPKHIQKPSISLFSQQSRGSVLALFFLSLVSRPWILSF